MSRDDMHWPERDAFADLLAAERDIEPPPDSSDRVLGRVMATLGAVPPPDGAAGDGGAGASAVGETAAVGPAGPIGTAGQVATVGEAASAGVSMSVSIGTGVSGATVALIGGSVVGALALGAWLVLSPAETPPPAPPTVAVAPGASEPTPEPAIAPPVAPATPIAEPNVAPAPPVVDPPPPAPRAVEPAPVVKTPPRRPRPALARPKPEPAPAPAIDDALRGEIELLGAARKALAADDADAALTALRAHARRFPDGRFDQEREILTIKVLVEQGRLDDARRRAAAFVRRHPDSLHRSTIDALIPTAEQP